MAEKYIAVGPQTAYANGKFDPVAFESSELGRKSIELRRMYNQYKRQPMHPEVLKYWESKGVKKELFNEDREAEQELFSVLSPINPEKNHKYPLLYVLHGGGEDAFSAEFYGYGDLVGMGNCICVHPTASLHGNPKVETEFERILNFLKEKNYPIDYTRVYVVGFSGGEGATQRIAMQHADKIAGIGPTPGPNSFRGVSLPRLQAEYNKKFGLEIPMICIGGSADGGDMWPLNTEQCVQSFNFYMQNVAKAPNYKPMTLEKTYEIARTSDDTVKRLFGIDFDCTWINRLYDTYIYFGEFYGRKGYPVARFGSIIGLPHTQCPAQAMFVWSYLRQFSRDPETKEIIYNEAEVGGANK